MSRTAAFITIAAAGFLALHRRVLAGPVTALTEDQVRSLAESITRSFGIKTDPAMIVRIAWIESNFDPAAVRPEPQIGDASVGLMQTLVGTARWLFDDLGYTAFGRPSVDTLMGPQASIYFGGAFIDWLSTYRGERRSEEWIVRSYNGGPGHGRAATDAYWRKYQNAKRRFG